MGLGWLVNVFAKPRTQGGRPTKHKGVISQDARGLDPGMQGDGFASERSGIMEVAMWLCVALLLGL